LFTFIDNYSCVILLFEIFVPNFHEMNFGILALRRDLVV